MDNTTLISLLALGVALAAMKFLPRLLAGVPFVAPADLKARLDRGEETLVIDVRSTNEFSGGHVPGAINLPVSEIGARLSRLANDLAPYQAAPVYVMCATANRSSHAARVLKKVGFVNIRVVDGGMGKWSRQGLPVTRTS